ncbi:MAG: hypothetical protein C5B54_03530 [Acidobacteria bacterium]|nr:MAG: hypothetical protein C5B54_03530 [Acidobacteriota bacterium]
MRYKGLYLFALLLLTFAGFIFAQNDTSNSSDQSSDQTKDQPSNTVGRTVTGVVLKINIDEKKIIIQKDSSHQTRTFVYNDQTTWRNPGPASITDLKAGDRITLIVTDDIIGRGDISPIKSTIENTSQSGKTVSPQ